MLKKRIIVSVTNDLSTDQRVRKVCETLVKLGFAVLLVGRILPGSKPINISNYKTKRFNLIATKGALFYAFYNIRLFFLLLFGKFDLLVANDLDTLPANYLVSKIRGKPLIYDTHEYFTEVPELVNRPKIKWIWKQIEAFIFPKLKNVITVNKSIAKLYKEDYGLDLHVVRNIPEGSAVRKTKSRLDLGLPENKKIIVLQGAGINIDRGGEELVEAMKYLENYFLVIVGSGDVIEVLKQMVISFEIEDRVIFKGKLPYGEMMQYTINADLGITLDKPTNINYRFSLPNKLFDYIHAGIAVLASDLVEVKQVVLEYQVGKVISNYDSKAIANEIRVLLEDEEMLLTYKQNTIKAAKELTWDKEAEALEKVYGKFL